jgi:hypothetical protein
MSWLTFVFVYYLIFFLLAQCMVSIVAHRQDRKVVVVRARAKEHLEAFFAGAHSEPEIIETQAADYRWRVYCTRDLARTMLTRAFDGINYPNFKNSVRDARLHRAYSRVWGVMRDYQDGTSPDDLPDLFGETWTTDAEGEL